MKHKDKFKQTEIGIIPEDWNIIKIGDVARINEVAINKNYSFEEIEYIDIDSVNNGIIEKSQILTLREAPSRAKRIVRDKDIIISTVRPNLKHFAFINKAKPNSIVSTGFAVITSKRINPRFLYYFLITDKYTEYLTAIADAHTSTYPSFNPDIIEKSYCPHPHEEEQTAIAKVLSDLDSKIELNQRMNKNLEAIGQALFKRWFIDFEFPNEEGKPYKSSGGELVDSELGEIPKGWNIGKLDSLGEFKNGVNYSREETGDTAFKIINVRDLVAHNFILESTLDDIYIDYKKAKDYLLNEGDIVIARSASPGNTIFIFNKIANLIYSGFSIRYRPIKLLYSIYLFCSLQEKKSSLLDISDGTTLKNINQATLKGVKIIIPESKVLDDFNVIMTSIYTEIVNIMNENHILSQTRDSLLPKLMSGKIRVPVEAIE
jgi:type I restriction enzyme S subunit